MGGTKSNANVFKDADIFIALPGAEIPTGGAPFGPEWDLVGLLDGSAGVTKKQAAQSKDFYAWGSILVATSRSQYKETVDFTVLEMDNPTVMSMLRDTSDVTFNEDGTYEGELGIPDLSKRLMVGIETRNNGVLHRLISKNYAQIATRGDQKAGEDDLESSALTLDIYSDDNGKLFYTYKGAEGSDATVSTIAVTPANPSVVSGATRQLTVTATMSDGSHQDVTANAVFHSATPAKATVSNLGLVTGVAAGSSVVTVQAEGKTANTTVTVTA